MNKKGFVDMVLLGAGALIVVAGVALWWSISHFHSNVSLTNSNVQTSTTAGTTKGGSPTPTPTPSPTPTTKPTPSPTPTSGTIKTTTGTPESCGNSLACLAAAAKTCTPAYADYSNTVNIFNVINETTQLHLTINGLNTAGKCIYSSKIENISLALTASAEATAKAQGTSEADLQTQLQTATAQQQKAVGTVTTCTVTPAELTSVLTSWQNGDFDVSFPAADCTAMTPSGQSVNGTISFQPITLGLFSYSDFTSDGVEFKVNSLTSSQLNLTVTDHNTGATGTATLTPNNTVTLAGHQVTVTSIQNIQNGTSNGQPTYGEEADISYK